MNILVLGGSYFLGKAFVEEIAKNERVTVLNRGTRPLRVNYSENINFIKKDRHDLLPGELVQLAADISGNIPDKGNVVDTVVDFCAYNEADIKTVAEALDGRFKQYIFISTVDSYKRGSGVVIDETGTLEDNDYGGEAGAYILGKVALENEIKKEAGKYGFEYTIVKPAFIYGEDNYAPREGIFFNWIDRAGQVIYPKDANGIFQTVYVKDLASAIKKSLCNEKLYGKSINILGPGYETYDSFCNALKYATLKDFERVEITVSDVLEKNIPLPFPLTDKESEKYSSMYEDILKMEYTSLAEGLRKTYRYNKALEIFATVDALFDENRPKDAEQYMLIEVDNARLAEDGNTELRILNELIGYYRQTSEKDNLLKVIDSSIRLAEKLRDGNLINSLDYATTTLNSANAYRSLSMLDDAKNYYEITMKLYEEGIEKGMLSKDDMLVAGLFNNISLLYQELKDFKSAIDYQLKALEISNRNEAGFEIAVSHANIANTYIMNSQFDKAEEYARKAIDLFIKRELKDPHYCAALSALAVCLVEKGEKEEAKKIYKEALDIVENTIGKNSQYARLLDSLNSLNN